MIPFVIERERNHERSYDLYSRLLKDRIIFLAGEVESNMANSIVGQLLFLDNQSTDDISIYINSPGGSIVDGMSIVDTMNYIKSDVATIVIGLAASMGSLISSSGTKGKRMCLPSVEYLIHQPLILGHGLSGQATDIEIHTKNLIKTKDKLIKILSENTGQSEEVIRRDTDRDNYMTAEEALNYGLVDKIISKRG